jgi:hypothetical protein
MGSGDKSRMWHTLLRCSPVQCSVFSNPQARPDIGEASEAIRFAPAEKMQATMPVRANGIGIVENDVEECQEAGDGLKAACRDDSWGRITVLSLRLRANRIFGCDVIHKKLSVLCIITSFMMHIRNLIG